uniref:Uncharacterized protein n=1 Tax=Anguilla anguilla TaxID=7936 RepID=A0A0E9SU27_ANGAN
MFIWHGCILWNHCSFKRDERRPNVFLRPVQPFLAENC